MRRRELLIGLGAAAAASGDAGAQPSPWRVGFLHPGQSGGVAMRIGRFEEGIRPFNGGDPVILKGVADDRVEELPRLAVTRSGQRSARSRRPASMGLMGGAIQRVFASYRIPQML